MLAFARSAPISISRPGLTRRHHFAPISRPIRIRINTSNVSCSLLGTGTHAIAIAGGLDAVQHVLFAPLFDPVDSCTPLEARIAAWLNFRAAVALFVISPLALFGASLARGPSTEAGDALTRVLSGYWQASALLLVAVLQHATGNSGAFAGGLLVQGVIVASLNWWEDLLEEIQEISISATSPDNSPEKVFSVWQPVATAAAAIGVLVQIPFQSCNFEPACACNAWREPPIRLFEILQFSDTTSLEMLANFGTASYLGYLAYYLAFVIPKIGRKGRAQRDVFTAPEVLIRSGIIGPWGEREKEGQQ